MDHRVRLHQIPDRPRTEDGWGVEERNLGIEGSGDGARHLVEVDIHRFVTHVAHRLDDVDIGDFRRAQPAAHLVERPTRADAHAQPRADDLLQVVRAQAGDSAAQLLGRKLKAGATMASRSAG